jgi:hypothetical protein
MSRFDCDVPAEIRLPLLPQHSSKLAVCTEASARNGNAPPGRRGVSEPAVARVYAALEIETLGMMILLMIFTWFTSSTNLVVRFMVEDQQTIRFSSTSDQNR